MARREAQGALSRAKEAMALGFLQQNHEEERPEGFDFLIRWIRKVAGSFQLADPMLVSKLGQRPAK